MALPLADPLHFGAEQGDAGLEGFEDVIVVESLAIVGNQRLVVVFLVGGRFSFFAIVSAALIDAICAASFTAAIMLPGSALPWPAMSNAVP